MTYYLGETILFVALVLTSLQVLRMHRELKRLRAYHLEFERVFSQTEAALDTIQRTIHELHASGREVVEELGLRIDAGRRVIVDLKALAARLEPAPAAARRSNAA
ncbi:hypothetical protein [Bosea sp. BK604]|uniref:hypothetical protein n=1 Tax=Bosea sp. BK604 TaxID=2512180 RepID=UPI00104D1F2E|nr:hypothetical protein [Bosea sp. BK604]TCR63652.1 hypothetical protein EV560_108300 [Bosea sp. BK604]